MWRPVVYITFAWGGLDYYTQKNCESKGYVPKWTSAAYAPDTNFEKLFLTPLALDVMTAGHGTQKNGFEQRTALWGCDYKGAGYYGKGADDPAGGGCSHGPIQAYEDLVCALKLGLEGNDGAFKDFCSTAKSQQEGWFECAAFFANVLVETNYFAEAEALDLRATCLGQGSCCTASGHNKKCKDDGGSLPPSSEFPSSNDDWLGTTATGSKCCTYHGRGFLHIKGPDNYKALSKAMVGNESELGDTPYKLDADGVAGWTAALWQWFNKNQGPKSDKSPREEIQDWNGSGGMPGAINALNPDDCDSDKDRGRLKAGMLMAVARRLDIQPIGSKTESYPLPGSKECESDPFCKNQFHNGSSRCKAMKDQLDCVTSPPIFINASTPLGFNTRVARLTPKDDGKTSLCKYGKNSGSAPAFWWDPQEPLNVIHEWWTMTDVTIENVCEFLKLKSIDYDGQSLIEGDASLCAETCEKYTEWLSTNVPGDSAGDNGTEIPGRTGPGLVGAMNGPTGMGDQSDWLCYEHQDPLCQPPSEGTRACVGSRGEDTHDCRIYPPGSDEEGLDEGFWNTGGTSLKAGQIPNPMSSVLAYFMHSNCPLNYPGDTPLEQMFPRGIIDMDEQFSAIFSFSDGYCNLRYDDFFNLATNKENIYYGGPGPKFQWAVMLCAYYLGYPNDPTIFRRKLFRKTDSMDPLTTEDEKRFALLEWASLAAHFVKETGNLGQPEERDPRCYCNFSGGDENPCCPNQFGNNPPCLHVDGGSLTPEAYTAGMTPLATCCSYHGRGHLQVSYEQNYGDLGAIILASNEVGVSSKLGRKYLINYPQRIDGFDVTGWVATFSFWVETHVCSLCASDELGVNSSGIPQGNCHIAMTKYDQEGYGFALTTTIINGMECDNEIGGEHATSRFGSEYRLTYFYHFAWRLQVKMPGEDTLVPLPGTVECDKSKWCVQFLPRTKNQPAGREASGGCYALTKKDLGGGKEMWPWCPPYPYKSNGSSRLGARLEFITFTLKTQQGGNWEGCTKTFESRCGAKEIEAGNKPSMKTHEELKWYLEWFEITSDYEEDDIIALAGVGPEQWCSLIKGSNAWGLCSEDCKLPAMCYGCHMAMDKLCAMYAGGKGWLRCCLARLEERQPGACTLDWSGKVEDLPNGWTTPSWFPDGSVPEIPGGEGSKDPPPGGSGGGSGEGEGGGSSHDDETVWPPTSDNMCAGCKKTCVQRPSTADHPSCNTADAQCGKCPSETKPTVWPCGMAPQCCHCV